MAETTSRPSTLRTGVDEASVSNVFRPAVSADLANNSLSSARPSVERHRLWRSNPSVSWWLRSWWAGPAPGAAAGFGDLSLTWLAAARGGAAKSSPLFGADKGTLRPLSADSARRSDDVCNTELLKDVMESENRGLVRSPSSFACVAASRAVASRVAASRAIASRAAASRATTSGFTMSHFTASRANASRSAAFRSASSVDASGAPLKGILGVNALKASSLLTSVSASSVPAQLKDAWPLTMPGIVEDSRKEDAGS
mmetsp:Transcript_29654/g.81161  ORF Transcript_29654/g.81161 Transcript_29654/m.81161 type:complete len:256 (-) Transcript_29654:122-889(-)